MTTAMVKDLMSHLSAIDQRDVEWAEAEALGYARGRMDASEDHNLPRLDITPMEFAVFHALHVATHLYSYRRGQGMGVRRPIRDSWDEWMRRP